jgi:DNA topoisomerase-3
MELEFAQQYSNWNAVPLSELFDAQIIKNVKQDMKPIADNLKRIGRDAQVLVIWTDNDLEGENIGIQNELILGAEVVSVVQSVNSRIQIKRARFSVVQEREIQMAWNNLDQLDYKKAHAVDARSELDLRIGAVFTRFQTLGLKNRFEELEDKKVISYGIFLKYN